MREFADSLPWWAILAVGTAVFWIFFELGYRLGRRRLEHADQDEKSQVSVISTTLLGLLGLLLAFSLDMVEERFQARKMLVVSESIAIGTAYLRAGMMPEPHGTRVRELLGEYVDGRIGVRPENIKKRLQQAKALQHGMWTEAEAVAEQQPDSEIVSLFVQSLNDVIDLHEERVAKALQHRLPFTIVGVLFVVSLLSIGGLGYSSGLTKTRPRLPTFVIILAIMVVETVIVDLDRPLGGLFQISQEAMIQLQETVFKR